MSRYRVEMAECGSYVSESDQDSSTSEENGCDEDSGIFERESIIDFRKPSQVKDEFWIWYRTERYSVNRPDILGKWLVFKHYDEIDATWEKIRTAIASNELQGCLLAKCSTMKYHPTLEGPGPSTTSVVCVYTEEHNMDDIGFKLIEIVKQDIKYKTDEDTLNYKYTHAGSGKVTIKTIYWNNGKPSLHCEDKPCYGTSFRREDIWHLNVVLAPEPFSSMEEHGRWILPLGYTELTKLWHFLKGIIECKEKNFGIIKMVCPPKRTRGSPTEMPVFHVYTSGKDSKSVGKKLIKLIKRDIDYEYKPRYPHMRSNKKTLFWNDGEPDYEILRRKGITKNWRTGEEVQ